MTEVESLGSGQLGFFTAAIKTVADTQVGALLQRMNPTSVPLDGFKPSVPVVFCGLFPIDAADYEQLREA